MKSISQIWKTRKWHIIVGMVTVFVLLLIIPRDTGDINSSISAYNTYLSTHENFQSTFDYTMILYDEIVDAWNNDNLARAHVLLYALDERLDEAEEFLNEETIAIDNYATTVIDLRGEAFDLGQYTLQNMREANRLSRSALAKVGKVDELIIEYLTTDSAEEPFTQVDQLTEEVIEKMTEYDQANLAMYDSMRTMADLR